ncbi:MAG: hypothetical protein GC154_21480 [bacterium]|nr:hypothetical protein [bacterium]
MATIVRHTPSGRRFVLVGCGYSSVSPGRNGSAVNKPQGPIDEGEFGLAAVCDEDGKVYWCETRELEVENVDGHTPSEWLKK